MAVTTGAQSRKSEGVAEYWRCWLSQ